MAGVIGAEFLGDHVRIDMSAAAQPQAEPDADGRRRGRSRVHCVNTGVPHAVVFVDDLEILDVHGLGAGCAITTRLRPERHQCNFVQSPDRSISIRTYERGVEDETLACGTGMVACALIFHVLTGAACPIEVEVQGGDTLEIGFEKTGDQASKT